MIPYNTNNELLASRKKIQTIYNYLTKLELLHRSFLFTIIELQKVYAQNMINTLDLNSINELSYTS